jgi:hypothetical protein
MQLQTSFCYSYVRGIVFKTLLKIKHKLYIASGAALAPPSKNSGCAPAPFCMLHSYMRAILSPNKCESEYISEELSNGSDGAVNNPQACL